MPDLLLGPLLRYVGEREATIWVETDRACEVEALGHRARTFHVEGHHYAVVHITQLEGGRAYPYTIKLDGAHRYPDPDSNFPPSVIRTVAPDEPLKLVFGSCRVSLPHEPPYTLTKDEDARGREPDALYALARRMLAQPPEERPHALLLLGDQVYADEVSPETEAFIRARRDADEPPGANSVADFEEYTRLYREAWSDPMLRWLLSTISTVMIFDDHDVRDDWNTSHAWVEEMRAKAWWDERIVGGFMAYWIYQHLGNLSPAELAADELYERVRAAVDAGAILRVFAYKADREPAGGRWSFHRDFGRTRLVMIDARAGRVLNHERKMIDDDEWRWIEDHATGGFDHLLIASSVPFLLAPALHYLEAWNERVCAGAWGKTAARLGERLRQAADLEHWAAFEDSFRRFAELLRAVASGERGESPASIVMLSGDVHHAYLAEVAFESERAADRVARSCVYQAVCSPFRNPLNTNERRAIRAAWGGRAAAISRRMALAAGVKEPDISWRLVHQEPFFDNQIAALELRRREAHFRIETTVASDPPEPRLDVALEHRIV